MQETKARARAEFLGMRGLVKNRNYKEKSLLGILGILGNRQQSIHSTQIKKENSEASHSQQDSDYLNPVYQASQEKKGFPSEENIAHALCHLVKQQSAPDIELNVFDGNTLDFYYFMALFHEEMEKRIDNPRERLARLLKYTGGNAKEMIKDSVQEPPAMGYPHANKIPVEK